MTKKTGFTLIEILVSTVLIVTLLVGAYGLIQILRQNQIIVLQSYLSVDGANSNVTDLIKTIRNARPSDNGSYPIESVDAQELIIYSDIDYDGESERLRYYLDGSDLNRGLIEPVGFPATYPVGNEIIKTLTDNVRNGADPVFQYFNGNWPEDTINNPMTPPYTISGIRLVRVNIKLNTEDNPRTDYILESYTQIRMLKDNL